MAEQQVTVDQHTYELQDPFFVMGTQNPASSEGTYKLPESQLDRFSMRISLGYPGREFEKSILLGTSGVSRSNQFTRQEILDLQKEAYKVHLDEKLIEYVLSLVEKTRNDPRLIHGISVRGSQELIRLSKTQALFEGRDFVIPEDIKELAPYVCSHRIQSFDLPDRASQEDYIRALLDEISIPI
jgi:MoxR-like ATPase